MVNDYENDDRVVLSMITRTWNPNLMFKYNISPSRKRALYDFHRHKNYLTRNGLRPIEYYGDWLATDEIMHLRRMLRTARAASVATWTTSETITITEKEQKA